MLSIASLLPPSYTYAAVLITIINLEEEERRRVQQAHFEAHVRGRGVPRAGEIFALL